MKQLQETTLGTLAATLGMSRVVYVVRLSDGAILFLQGEIGMAKAPNPVRKAVNRFAESAPF